MLDKEEQGNREVKVVLLVVSLAHLKVVCSQIEKANLLNVCFFTRYLHFNNIESLEPESFTHLPKLERL